MYFVLSNCSASSGVIISGCPEESRSIMPSELLFILVSPKSSDNGVSLFFNKIWIKNVFNQVQFFVQQNTLIHNYS